MLERELIDWIRSQSRFDPHVVPVGPGDDCAVINLLGEQVLITTDQVLDGVHFELSRHGPRAAGRKAMGRNLSDIAAMAGIPTAAVASVALPRGTDRNDSQEIYAGLRDLADEFDCALVGGDVGTWDGPLGMSVTVFGRRGGPNGEIDPVLRGGAKVGDSICVSGQLGGAWQTQRHLHFTPRIHEAISLATKYRLKSMIDISDGLSTDLDHLCAPSNVGAEIVAADIPLHDDAYEHASEEHTALQAALNDGEDYELLFTLGQAEAKKLCVDQPLSIHVTCIGQITKGNSILLIQPDGRREELRPCGWEHTT